MTDAMRAESIVILGARGDGVEAYLAQPLEHGRVGGVVVIHHMPGYDEATKEITRNVAAHGFLAICPNLYSREAPGRGPDEGYEIARATGGVPDERLVGDVHGAAEYLRSLGASNGKVATMGFCSGGRQSFLAACALPLDAAVDCYGAFVVSAPAPELGLIAEPVIHLSRDLSCPLLGLFGADDQFPSPWEVAEMERVLTLEGKEFEFHSFAGAGHAFMATNRPTYRPEAAVAGWTRVWDFLGRHL
jgi:carboxymethylenebutenolidase